MVGLVSLHQPKGKDAPAVQLLQGRRWDVPHSRCVDACSSQGYTRLGLARGTAIQDRRIGGRCSGRVFSVSGGRECLRRPLAFQRSCFDKAARA